MKGTSAYAAAVLASIIVLGFIAVVPLLQPTDGPKSTFSLQFVRTGGFAGTNDTFTVDASGGATYSSRFGPSFNATLSAYEFSHLKQELSTDLARIQPKVFQPRGGAADFFAYGLVVRFGDQTTQLSWVDEWASSEPFPAELHALQQTLQDTIQVLTARTTFTNIAHADLPVCRNGAPQAALCGTLTLTIFTYKSSHKSGDEVRIFVTLSNTGPRSINYTSPTPCDPDIRIIVAGGNQSQDLSFSETPVKPCIQVLQLRSLDTNGTITQSATWNLMFDAGGSSVQAAPGTYVITAKFPFASFESSLLQVTLEIVVE